MRRSLRTAVHRYPLAFLSRPTHKPEAIRFQLDAGQRRRELGDVFEMYLWFVTRGDECIDCPPRGELMHTSYMPLIIRVKPLERKTERGRGQTVDGDQLLSALTSS